MKENKQIHDWLDTSSHDDLRFCPFRKIDFPDPPYLSNSNETLTANDEIALQNYSIALAHLSPCIKTACMAYRAADRVDENGTIMGGRRYHVCGLVPGNHFYMSGDEE